MIDERHRRAGEQAHDNVHEEAFATHHLDTPSWLVLIFDGCSRHLDYAITRSRQEEGGQRLPEQVLKR